jgi:cation transport ATPase
MADSPALFRAWRTGSQLAPWERETTFAVGGLACRGCARHAERLLAGLRGVHAASVGYLAEVAQVRYDVRAVSERDLAEAVERAGFSAMPIDGARPTERDAVDPLRLGLVLVLLANQLGVALLAAHHPELYGVGWVRLGLALLVVGTGLAPLASRALASARRGRITHEATACVAAVCAFALGVLELAALAGHGPRAAAWRGAGPMGFETVGAVVALALIASAASASLRRHALTDLERRADRRREPVRRVDATGDERAVPCEALDVGDTIRVVEGETIPADLVLVTPARLLFGEPEGETAVVERAPGEHAPVRAVLLSPAAVGRVARAPGASLDVPLDAEVHRALARLDARSSSHGSFAATAAAAASTAVLSLSAFAVLLHVVARGASGPAAWAAAVAVLAGASSTAFTLALPAARTAALARARRAGIVIKDPAALDALARADAAFADGDVLGVSGAAGALRALGERGLSTLALGATGDAVAVTGAASRAAAAQPAEPTRRALAVRELQLAGAHVMLLTGPDPDVDAADARADVTVAVAPGVLPAAVPAPVVIAQGGLERLPWLIDVARATRRVVRQSVALAIVYDATVVPLAVAGVLAPLQAAALAIVVSAATLANAARLLE